jgi:hypothetical protein
MGGIDKDKERFGFGELKETEPKGTYMKLPPDLKAQIKTMRGKKSWGVWLREVVNRLTESA